MKISYDWLKEYIEIKEPPERLAAILTNSGSEVKSIEKSGGDFIMDIEITPNRSDCLNYLGIAREMAAITGKKVNMPPLKTQFTVHSQRSADKEHPAVEIKDKNLCPRYTARLITGVSVKESPEWLKKRITSMGMRPVNNVVDIINFALFETGQPMHAFDYDRIDGGQIVIRRAVEGEKIVSIDNVERRLEKDMLVIADSRRPIAIAGIMGGLDTEVSAGTKNIFLESAYFNPVSVRRTSYKLSLSSESSYRFERSVDPEMVIPASNRAALLISEICGGKIEELVDRGEKPGKQRNAELRIERLNKLLNLALTESYVKKALTNLSLKPVSKKKGIIKISIPSFRQDIKYEIDIIEEVARIYGYDKIAVTIPKIAPDPERKPLSWKLREKTIDILTSLGMKEVITYGMISKNTLAKLERFFGRPFDCIIPVANPLSFDQEIMRPYLMPGILDVLSRNMNRGIKDLMLFEIGKRYDKNIKSKRYETTSLCVALSGNTPNDWQREKEPARSYTYCDLIEILRILFSKLGLEEENLKKEKLIVGSKENDRGYYPIFYKNIDLGFIAIQDSSILDLFELRQKVFIAEIDLDVLKHCVSFEKKFTGIPKYPSIKRDISLIANREIAFKSIVLLVTEKGADLVEEVELLDRYSGKQIPEDRQGLTFRIEYRARTRTLTSEEVDNIHLDIRNSLVEKLGAELR